ncbi:hypothetical protein [Agrobacterium sp.]|uniref:hypothetical protein n=1 Tax=Agrobacterium sp. TaxID=361 RepID=UPI0028A86A4A|nr:hypothetical protein [Agrobacterium sp.]
MTGPSFEKPMFQVQIRPLLCDRVTLYTSSPEMRERIVEVTILKATSDPFTVFEEDVEGALYHLLHETAVEEMHINKDMYRTDTVGQQLQYKE